jgi:hypothetical protein
MLGLILERVWRCDLMHVMLQNVNVVDVKGEVARLMTFRDGKSMETRGMQENSRDFEAVGNLKIEVDFK